MDISECDRRSVMHVTSTDLWPPAVSARCGRAAHSHRPIWDLAGARHPVPRPRCRAGARRRADGRAGAQPDRPARRVRRQPDGGLPAAGGRGFPAVLETALRRRATTSRSPTRACRAIPRPAAWPARLVGARGTDAVILELGANDMLRGLDPGERKRSEIADASEGARTSRCCSPACVRCRARAGLCAAFDAIYPASPGIDVPLYPFFLEACGRPEPNLPDGLHPNARASTRSSPHPALVEALVVPPGQAPRS